MSSAYREILQKTEEHSALLLAVSKLQPVEKIRELYLQGQRDFAENYVQEALDKQKQLADLTDLRWHLIGHLQKNKAKLICQKFHLIHSVDSLQLAELIDRKTKEVAHGHIQKILLQVNIASEDSKEGFDVESLIRDWPQLISLSHLQICGLMTMPPLENSPENNRTHFKKLSDLLKQLKTKTPGTLHPLSELSMGTSHDFQVALQEGATIVRLGTILFGERPQKALS